MPGPILDPIPDAREDDIVVLALDGTDTTAERSGSTIEVRDQPDLGPPAPRSPYWMF